MPEYPSTEPTFRQPVAYLRLAGPLISGDGIILRMDRYIRSVETEYGLDSAFMVTFNLFDPAFDVIEKVIHIGGSGTYAHFSYGYRDGIMSREYYGLIKNYTSRITPGGTELSIIIQPPNATILQAKPVPGMHFGERKISDAVYFAALSLGIPKNNIFIEETRDVVSVPPFLKGMTFSTWLTEVAGMARPKRETSYGTYSYQFDEDNVFRFATHGVDPQFRMRLYDTYVYGHANDGRVIDFGIVDQRQMMAYSGVGSTAVRHVDLDDPTDGLERYGVNDGAEEAVTEDGGMIDVSDGQGFGRAGGYVDTRISSEYVGSAEEARIRARQAWMLYSGYHFHMEMRILGDPHVLLGDFVYVRIVKRNGQPHFMSGYYSIKRVAHSISRESFVTSITGIRRASSIGDIIAANVTIPTVLGENNSLIGERLLPSIGGSPGDGFVLGAAYYDEEVGHLVVPAGSNIEISSRITTRVPNYVEPPDSDVPGPYTPSTLTQYEAEPEDE